MIRRLLVAAAALLLALDPALAQPAGPCGPRRLALTFDDAPRPGTAVMSGWERTGRIIGSLAASGVDQAAFFSLGGQATGEGRERLLAYAAAGHVIANHSQSHPNLHRVGAAPFIADVRTSHAALSPLPGFRPWFRFPYLNEGRDAEERDAVREALEELGYRQGYVTIDTYDFYIDNHLRRAAAEGRSPDLAALERLYVDSIAGAAGHYDALACRWLGRSPAHLLLLHENDAAALFLRPLIAALREQGWTIMTAEEAFADPIADTLPETLTLGQGRVAALARLAGAPVESLRHSSENIEHLDRLLAGIPVAPDPAIAAIEAQSRRFSQAYVDADLDTLVSIYAEDGVAAPPGRNFVRGRDAMRRLWQVADGVDVVAHRAVPEQIRIEGRLAYDWGRYSGATIADGQTRPFRGKYLIVWRLDADDQWRMVQDFWSGVPDEPAVPAGQ